MDERLAQTGDHEIRQQLADATAELYRAGLVTASGGNLSVRAHEHPDAAWITPSRLFKGALRPEDMVLVDLAGRKLLGTGEPSVEAGYHTAILKLRPDINAVVHTHAPLATAFGMSDLAMPPISTEAILVRDYPIIPFLVGGSEDLARAVITSLGNGKASGAFLRNHGLITLGKSLRQAADRSYTAEHAVKVLLICKALGGEPSQIPQAGIDALLGYLGHA